MSKEAMLTAEVAVLTEMVRVLSVKVEQQEQGEPVAWVCNGVNNTHDIDFDENDVNALPVGTMLYTTPQQRKPLTDEQIEKMRHLIDWTAHWSYGKFARAIEAAHEIKEKK